MTEQDKNNVVHLCSDHANERLAKFQENLDDNLADFMLELNRKGRGYVKNGFVLSEDSPEREHMWVEVTSIAAIDFNARTITGTLNNEPMYLTGTKLHDKVVISFDTISDTLT